jgi:CRISPR/Cas system-associated protein Cas5 (RAMP superfamily)
MTEELRNARSTFARMTAKVFKEDKAIYAYVDDIIVQRKLKQNNIKDLERAFTNLRNVGCKLNPEKCIFGVSKGKLLSCLISARESKPT